MVEMEQQQVLMDHQLHLQVVEVPQMFIVQVEQVELEAEVIHHPLLVFQVEVELQEQQILEVELEELHLAVQVW